MQMLLHNAQLALTQLIVLYVIVGVGVAAERLGWFRAETARQASGLLLYVVTACVIVRSFYSMEFSRERLRGFLISAACGVLLHVLGILISEPFFRSSRDAATESVLHFAAIYGNCGYMALPLAQAMVGEEGVFYCSAVILSFQVFSFTHGAYTMAGGAPLRRKNAHTQSDAAQFRWKTLFLNAGVLSVVVGLPLFLFAIPLPELITKPVDFIAGMNTPLAMLMFGAYLSHTKLKGFLRSKKIFSALGIKLLALPALVMAALLAFGVRGALLNALLISASAPSANNTVVFAAKYGRDPGYAAQIVGFISIASIVTMPLVIAVGLSMK
jgi:predicted permease